MRWFLSGIGILCECLFALWHVYMQRVIYRTLWEKEVRRANPRGAALLYISLTHLIGNVWTALIILFSSVPNWLLIFRIINASIIIIAVDNYLRRYTGSNILEKGLEWLKPKDR